MQLRERVTALEVEGQTLRKEVDNHEILLTSLKQEIADLTGEVRKIRGALWFMAISLAANVPAVSDLASKLKSFFL